VLAGVAPIARAAGAELIVADNGSTDATPDVVRATPTARHVVEPIAGATRVRNTAMRAAGGDVLVFIDDDAVPRDGWFAGITAPFADARVAVVGGRVHLHYGQSPPAWWDRSFDDYLAFYDLGDAPIDLATRPWYDSPRGANMAVRRSALLDIAASTCGSPAGRPAHRRRGERSLPPAARARPRTALRPRLERGPPDRHAPSRPRVALRARVLERLVRSDHRARASAAPEGARARPLPLSLSRGAPAVPARRHGRPATVARRVRAPGSVGYILGLLRHLPLRGRLVQTA
jgi:hypothetical protein